MNIIFEVNGGIGKNIMATAVCKAIKTQYPNDKLIVVTAYNDVFINNPNVDRCFNFANLSYFHEEYIDGKEVKLCLQDPYRQTDFLKREKSLMQIWCEMFSIKYNGEMPEVFLTEREKNFYSKQFQTDKPLFVMQTNGGAENQTQKYSWARDIPSKNVGEVIEHFKNDFAIAHIRREDQIGYEFTTPIQGNYRSMVVLIAMSKMRLFIDSFAQHTAMALNLPSVVCWIVNSPRVFGYFTHKNIEANEFTNKPELVGSYIDKFDISGNLLQFPYNSEDEIFDTQKIIDAIESLKK
jgi:hypothetical protein